MQFNNPASTKTDNIKYDNSSLKKINWTVAFAVRFSSHRARPKMLYLYQLIQFNTV